MTEKLYTYIFTRQDLSPEQQIVQSSHAAMQLGYELGLRPPEEASTQFITSFCADPSDVHFTIVGVRNVEALLGVKQILKQFNFEYEIFFEPDDGGQPTSIAVYPVEESKKGPLLAFNLLRL